MTSAETMAERDQMSLLHEISIALNADLDLDSILTTAVGFVDRLSMGFCEIYLLADTGHVYFKSSHPERNNLTDEELQSLVHGTLAEGLTAWVLQTGQSALVVDAKTDALGSPSPSNSPENEGLNRHLASFRSIICAPIVVGYNHLRGIISFAHPNPNHFNDQDLALLRGFATQIAIALKHTTLLDELQNSLRETHLLLDISRQLSGALNLNDVYNALIQTMMASGVDRCTVHLCDDIDANNLPRRSEVVAVGDVEPTLRQEGIGYRFSIAHYPLLNDLLRTQETVIVDKIASDERLTAEEREFLQRVRTRSVVITPLVSRAHVIGLIFIGYRSEHTFSERELALYRTLCNQTTIAIEHARQIQRTEFALAETQTLYRAGRVLAGAADLQEILQEALIEFVYSLGLDQGGVTLVGPDRQYCQLMAYVQNGQLQSVEKLKFPLDDKIPYQHTLLSGRPFVSVDAPNDPDLADFHSFNKEGMPKSLLEAPMIIRGETIGWIGADAVKEHRQFTQQEIDLARAMADQIAITIQNRRLLEQTERRASRLKAVAKVGESVSRMLNLEEIFNTTVDLIRDRFGFYHVSIFLVDEARDWAVVHASTGEVGKIMVQRPHRLQVGGNSIVGFVTANGQSRIALDVGEDAVHFQNPLLPYTRSEIALPLISRGIVIGALDVQSTEVNAFSDEDVDTLQIMADQLTNAIESVRLLQSAQDGLARTESLYRISDALATSTDQRIATEIVLGEYLHLLNLSQGTILFLDKTGHFHEAQALFVEGQPIEPHLTIPAEEDPILQHLLQDPTPLVISDTHEHPLTKNMLGSLAGAQAMLAIPLVMRDKVAGVIIAGSGENGYAFSQNNIEIGEAIADQLAVWLENRQLFAEAQYRSERLQTVAEISRASSSILDVNKLINTSVNLIRDQFDFYYVGLFMVDEAREWAILRAGTGEAGHVQLEHGHRLKIGGESMIGWCVQNRQARIALDVGQEAVRFQNPFLPDTHSEMALPLISRDEVIGALTVQSTERGAFSAEDITLLQAMADQLANAIENARLFAQTQKALSESESLYRITQDLLSAHDEETVFRLAMEAISRSGADSATIFMYLDSKDASLTGQILEQKAMWTTLAEPTLSSNTRFKAADLVIEGLIPQHGALLIEDTTANDPRLTEPLRRELTLRDIKSLVAFPLSTYQSRLGFLLVTYKTKGKVFSQQQIRFYNTITQQMVVALENLRLLDASQRRARREEIIREITGKIRSTTNVEDILKTTVTELGKVLGTSQGGITLGVNSSGSLAELQATSELQNHAVGNNIGAQKSSSHKSK